MFSFNIISKCKVPNRESWSRTLSDTSVVCRRSLGPTSQKTQNAKASSTKRCHGRVQIGRSSRHTLVRRMVHANIAKDSEESLSTGEYTTEADEDEDEDGPVVLSMEGVVGFAEDIESEEDDEEAEEAEESDDSIKSASPEELATSAGTELPTALWGADKPGHRAGFAAIVGRPNAGKSTLMNCLVGQKLSIVTYKPQTTRHRVLGIVSEDDFQMILLDTPGVIDTRKNKMEDMMMKSVTSSVKDADVIVCMVDAAGAPWAPFIMDLTPSRANPPPGRLSWLILFLLPTPERPPKCREVD
ncbi:hypothetical protein CYMTET_15568 [Cymbomonas tetramitiformis]|uniref:Era-type G domain-containing protein n=1 Tax=Cymbomonas tetramitiformis TaxID=36881 RepID=A0AAE0L8V8_9CHLO|nr:hypothetical protein CYMTET_15568 [Cymbomonas tetramitiformis]